MVDNRRARRKDCNVRATIRSRTGKCKAYVVDLNEFGVRLLMENTSKSISEGDEVEIQTQEFGVFKGRAIWRSSHRVGIELSGNAEAIAQAARAPQQSNSPCVEKVITQDGKIAADLVRVAARPEMFSKAEMAELMKRAARKMRRDEATLMSLREVLTAAIFVRRGHDHLSGAGAGAPALLNELDAS